MTVENEEIDSPAKSPGFFEKLFGSNRDSSQKSKKYNLFESKSNGSSSRGSSVGLANYNPPQEKEDTPFEEETSHPSPKGSSHGESGTNGEEEKRNKFEDTMRDVLRKLDVDVEDDDDWKQMVVKTRLHLKDFKNNFTGTAYTMVYLEMIAHCNINTRTNIQLKIIIS